MKRSHYGLCVLAAAALLSSGCGQKDAVKAAETVAGPKPVTVETALAETRHIDKAMGVTGALFADEEVSVNSQVQGRVERISVDFGAAVRKGQVLVELDTEEYALQLDRARAALAQALARVGLKPGELGKTPETTPAIDQAKAQLEDTRFKFESAQKLVKTGDISGERFNELEKAYNARQAAYEASLQDLRMQLAAIQSLVAEVKLAEKRLRDTTIVAPFDGAVSARGVSLGQLVKDTTPLLTIVKTNPLRLRVEIPESAVASVQPGSLLKFTTDSSKEAYEAVVRELNPSLDARSRTLTVEARIAKADSRLRPGMFVQVQLVVERNQDVVVVPKAALYTVAGLSKVFVVEGGKAHERRIIPGTEGGGWVEIPGGMVAAGSQVAVTNIGDLIDGSPVEIDKAARPAANTKTGQDDEEKAETAPDGKVG